MAMRLIYIQWLLKSATQRTLKLVNTAGTGLISRRAENDPSHQDALGSQRLDLCKQV